jgi:hypothetical protein
MLEKYQHMFAGIAAQQPVSLEQTWTYQELLYRMEALQVCQMFCANAPVGTDMRAMFTHYQMVDGYLENLKNERRCGLPAGDEEQKQRDAAHQNLCRIVGDYRKRFGSFAPSMPDQYKNEIGKTITTFLPAWIQARNAYIKINSKEAQ